MQFIEFTYCKDKFSQKFVLYELNKCHSLLANIRTLGWIIQPLMIITICPHGTTQIPFVQLLFQHLQIPILAIKQIKFQTLIIVPLHTPLTYYYIHKILKTIKHFQVYANYPKTNNALYITSIPQSYTHHTSLFTAQANYSTLDLLPILSQMKLVSIVSLFIEVCSLGVTRTSFLEPNMGA